MTLVHVPNGRSKLGPIPALLEDKQTLFGLLKQGDLGHRLYSVHLPPTWNSSVASCDCVIAKVEKPDTIGRQAASLRRQSMFRQIEQNVWYRLLHQLS